MASLVGEQLKDTYDSLLKTSDNDALVSGSYKEITDGAGNGSNLYLGQDGNVGIGISPNVNLEVAQSLNPILRITSTSTSSGDVDSSTGRIEFFSSSSAGNGAGIKAVIDTEATTATRRDFDLTLKTSTNVGSGEPLERARFKASGDISFRDGATNEAFYWDASTARLGIGTTSPVKKLQVTNGVSGDAGNLLLVNTNDTNGDTASLQFSMTDTDSFNKAGIFFERTTTQGRGSLHFANNIENNSNNVTKSDARLTIDSSGNVGINDTVSANFTNNYDTKLLVGGDIVARSKTSNESMVAIGGDATSAFIKAGKQDASLTARALRFEVGSSEAMRIDSDGLKFNGDTASANALDDYEEGTFDATIYEVGGSDILVEPDANYVKIGSLVHIQVRALGGTTGTSGVVRMNLPFTNTSKGGANIVAYTAANGSIVSVFCIDGTNYVEFVDTIGTIAAGNKSIGSDWGASSRLYFNFTYSTT